METINNNNTLKVNLGRLCAYCVLFLVTASGIKWIPLVQFGSIAIEMHNAASLLGLIMTATMVLYRNKIVLPKEFFLMFVIALFIVTFSIYRGQNVPRNIIVSLPALLGAMLIFQYASLENLKKKYWVGFLLLFIALFVSARVSQKSFFEGLFTYLVSFDRNTFLFQTLRPIFNAFSTSTDEIVYDGPMVNHLASGFYIFFVIACGRIIARENRFADWIIVALSFLMIFILFSSTVLGATLLVAGIALFFGFIQVRSQKGVFAGFAMIILITPIVLPYTFGYLSKGLSGEAGSIDTRVAQNRAAFDSISSNLITGGGTVSHGGHGLHNLPLYAWTEGGIVAFFSVIALYAALVVSIIYGLNHLVTNKQRLRFEAFLLVAFPIFILVRTFFGGGGGMPATSEAVAMGLMVSARRAFGVNFRIKKIKLA